MHSLPFLTTNPIAKVKCFSVLQFFTCVESVKPIKTDVRGKEKWEVKVRDVRDKDSPQESNIFDAVIVCNG